MPFHRLLTVSATILLCAAPAAAQKPPRAHPGEGQRRAMLERQFRERGEQIVRKRLNLSDDQMRQLRGVNGRLDARRRALMQKERATRVALRQELARGDAADQSRVAQLMNDTRSLQEQRFALQQEEQRELSAFLTPVQQAQYFGLQAQLRERMRRMREEQRGADSTDPSP
jgi:Spy/CpxP family protein refolding chaperone